MDVPLWHPASNNKTNQPLNHSNARTEFKVMVGSEPDLSYEAGKHLMSEIGEDDSFISTDIGGAIGTTRGYFDSSDRLYLREQIQEKRKNEQEMKIQKQKELKEFYQRAIKANSLLSVDFEQNPMTMEIAHKAKIKQKKEEIENNITKNMIKIKKKKKKTNEKVKVKKYHRNNNIITTRTNRAITKKEGSIIDYESSSSEE